MLRTLFNQPTRVLSRSPTTTTNCSIRSISSSSPLLSTSTEPSLSEGEQLLKSKLESSLSGASVKVQDVSGGCGSFYAIQIEHESFRGLNTIKQHRIVNQLLSEEIKGMHGLQLKTGAPSSS
ncbi:hypothetical protein JCM5350_007318 [Sporobolomyces pararoseus]